MARYLWTFLVFAFLLAAAPAFATGEPLPGQIDMQPAASTSAEKIHAFHDFILWIIAAISIFVLALLVYVVVRFNKKANPEPAQFSHNALIEVIWTVIPVIILIVILIPSMQLLYYTDRTETPDMTLKVTGYQWYWGYQYPDHEGIEFQSYMIADADIDPAKNQRRLLSTDTHIVLPVDTNIQILMTAADVLHSWTVPALGVKIDAVPGRTNETWVRITKPGTYFGQCSELCGKDHSFMPIEIRAVTKEEFDAWAAQPTENFIYNFDDYKLAGIPAPAPAADQEAEGQ
jgi:cytochrome c oxidase subunit 2